MGRCEDPAVRRLVSTVVLVLAVTAGCSEQSRVDPNATVRVHGVATDTDGSPLAERPVRLGSGIGTDAGIAAVVTLGLSCVGGGCTGRVEDTMTASDGTWSFAVKGRETQSAFGEALTQLVSTSAAPSGDEVSGASAWARFRVQKDDVALPALRLVDPHLTVSTKDEHVTTAWTATRPGPYELTFESGDRVPVWRATVGTTTASVDERILEDTDGRAVVAASTTDAIAGSDVTLGWRSPGVAYASPAGAPPSRGRPCTFETNGPPSDAATDACGLTDGDLATPASLPPTTTAAIIDLGRAVPGQLVVVRGCTGSCAVDVAGADGAWRPAGGATGDFAVLPLDGGPIARVRVHVVATSASALREVSVWGPAPTRPRRRSADVEDLRRPYADVGGHRTSRTVAVALAAALAALALAGAGYVAGRRRTQHLRL
jgi:hypothetical protein